MVFDSIFSEFDDEVRNLNDNPTNFFFNVFGSYNNSLSFSGFNSIFATCQV